MSQAFENMAVIAPTHAVTNCKDLELSLITFVFNLGVCHSAYFS